MGAAMSDRSGEEMGAYTVGAHVADGSMGAVYQARHRETGERLAIKVLHSDVARDPVAVERFRREYETAKALRHAHIVSVRDYGETSDGSQFMTMELLDGEELASTLARTGSMPPARLVRCVCQLALALNRAHSEGVIHRDLKPSNIFVCGPDEKVRVLDFGSVKLQMATGPKLTALGTTLGSPYYMSPEQAAGEPDVDPRTDVFALAAITLELATGRVAFAGENVAEILMKIVGEEPPAVSTLNPDYSWDFDTVVKKGLGKDKRTRYPSAIAYAEALLRAVALEPKVERWASASTASVEDALRRQPKPAAASMPAPISSSELPPLPEREPRAAAIAIALAATTVLAAASWFILS